MGEEQPVAVTEPDQVQPLTVLNTSLAARSAWMPPTTMKTPTRMAEPITTFRWPLADGRASKTQRPAASTITPATATDHALAWWPASQAASFTVVAPVRMPTRLLRGSRSVCISQASPRKPAPMTPKTVPPVLRMPGMVAQNGSRGQVPIAELGLSALVSGVADSKEAAHGSPWRTRLLRVIRRRKRWLVGAAAVALTYVGYFNIPGSMTGDALVTSLSWQDRVSDVVCYSAAADRSRECIVWPVVDRDTNADAIRRTGGSYFPAETYKVVSNRRCWTARKTDLSDIRPPMPDSLRGCIVIGDNIRLLGRVLRSDPNDHFELHPDDQ